MAHTNTDNPPLCVDLDGTLIYSDVLYEVFLVLIRKNLLYLFLVPLWVLRGKAHFKHRIAEHCELDPATLPYNQALLDWLRIQREQGRPLVLATATHNKFAQGIADHLGIFDRVLASDAHTNLSGRRKLNRLKQEYGAGGFDYAGNGHIDLDVWPETRRAIVVNPDAGVLEAAEKRFNIEKVFPVHGRSLWHYLRSLRPLHWAKNSLLLLPLLIPGNSDLQLLPILPGLLIGLLAFSLCSSAAYLLNDLIDLPSDRRHPVKQQRPLATSGVPLLHGLLLIPLLLLATALLSLFLPPAFAGVLLAYLLLNATYTLWLKRLPILDLLALTGLYQARVLAGAALIGGSLPDWFVGFTTLVFLAMAAAKRYAGLIPINGFTPSPERSHRYRSLLTAVVVLSSLAATLLLLSYAPITATTAWLLSALLVAWLAHLWRVTVGNRLYDDPVVFALTDRVSQGLLVIAVVVLWAASMQPF